MPFNNDIAGGNGTLVRNWIQSVNFVAGVSGWRISKDGNAEFNNGTFRGSIEVGPIPGQHFIVNNPGTGDVIDVYDSSNRLVAKIDNQGSVTTIDPVVLDQASLFGNGILWINQSRPPFTQPEIFGQGDNTNGNVVSISTGAATNAGWVASITLNDTKANSGGAASIVVDQRGTGALGVGAIDGTLVQTDNINPQDSAIHIETYNVATDPGGTGTFNHNCRFTPKHGWLVGVNGIGANFPYQYAWFANPFTGTTAKAAFKDNLGAALVSTTLGVMGFFTG